MGCDIHAIVQRKNSDDVWETIELPEHVSSALHQRDYDVFAILAGVRGDITPISEPRGLPEDFESTQDEYGTVFAGADPIVRDADGDLISYDRYMGDHSYSWLTLAELNEYSWAGLVKHYGFVAHKDYWGWNKYDRAEMRDPRSYCKGASGPTIVIVSDEEGRNLPRPKRDDSGFGGTYVQCSWWVPVTEAAGRLYTVVMPYLNEQAQNQPERIRLVFGFDS